MASTPSDSSSSSASDAPPAGALRRLEAITHFESFLRSRDLVPERDPSDNLIFRVGDRTYVLLSDDQEPECYRLAFPNFWKIDSAAEGQLAALAAWTATAQTKVAKVYLAESNTWAVVEAFATREQFTDRFFDHFHALSEAVATFVRIMSQKKE